MGWDSEALAHAGITRIQGSSDRCACIFTLETTLSTDLQRRLRILFMPPVYAIISFLSYRFFRYYTYYSFIYIGESGCGPRMAKANALVP